MPLRIAVVLTLVLGTLVLLPALDAGLFADDYVVAAMLDGRFAAPRAPLDLFNFACGGEDVAALQRLGSLPWWTPPDFNVSFMRPLSSLLWHLDRALFGDALWLYHAHSIAAWALLVLAVAALYRRVLPLWLAAMATLIYGLDESLHFPTVWLSNRGGLYAMALGVLGVLLHVRAREEGSRGSFAASSICFALALGFGEWAFPAFGYVLAYELASDLRKPLRRLACLLPAAVPALSFLIARAALGYGARGSGAYIDPGAEPLRFAAATLQRVPVLVGDMVWSIPASWWDHGSAWRDDVLALQLFSPQVWKQLPDWRGIHLLLGVSAIAALAAGLRLCWRGLDASEQQALRWLVPGALLALIPVVGAFTSSRLAMGALVGVAPVFAIFLRGLSRVLLATASRTRFALAYGGLAGGIAFLLLLPLAHDIDRLVYEHRTTTEWALSAELDLEQVADQRVFLLSSSEFTTSFFFAYVWSRHGRPPPRSFYPLSTAPYALHVEREGDRVLRLSTLGGSFLGSGQEHMFRARDDIPREGERVSLPGVEVRVIELLQGRPRTLELRFDTSLDDPSLVFLVSSELGMTRFRPPRPGESRRLRRASYPSWVGLQRTRQLARLGPVPEFMHYTPLPPLLDFGNPRPR